MEPDLSVTIRIVAYLLAIALLLPGLAKLARYREFGATLRWLEGSAAIAFAVACGLVECGVATLLVVRPVVGATVAAVWMIAATTYLGTVLAHPERPQCSCFTYARSARTPGYIGDAVRPDLYGLRNTAYFAMAALILQGAPGSEPVRMVSIGTLALPWLILSAGSILGARAWRGVVGTDHTALEATVRERFRRLGCPIHLKLPAYMQSPQAPCLRLVSGRASGGRQSG